MLRLRYFGLLVLLFVAFFANSSFAEFREGRLLVKFKSAYMPGTALFSRQLEPQLTSYLGNFSIKSYVDKNLLQSLSKRKNTILGHTQLNNLGRIFRIEFSRAISPEMVSAKLSGNPGIEYCEPEPKHEIVYIPNDPFLYLEYHLTNIKAMEAWDSLSTQDTALVGIVDTGVDYLHPDLAPNMYVNPDESGLDSNGIDKSINQLDDDNNGYIDDWRGWDFMASSSETLQDNDPFPGNLHGTHVAGITAAVINDSIGVAGVAKNVRIMPVKIAWDDPGSRSVENGYEGILYAASAGCDVINCSWGGSSRSDAEQEIIDAAVAYGAVIVAAAGNDSKDGAFYPASYNGVMSVAATTNIDDKAYFSNYHSSVDVSAPGENIYSTIPSDSYTFMSGTSMASPVAAGVAAMARLANPEMTNEQLIEHIKSTADNIDSNDAYYAGKIGKGRVNAYRAVTEKNKKALVISEIDIKDENNDGMFDEGELVTIRFTLKNVLVKLGGVYLKPLPGIVDTLDYDIDSLYFGQFETGEVKSPSESLRFRIPAGIPVDYKLDLKFGIYDDSDYSTREVYTITVKPSYRFINSNNIHTTINSRGNIAFNDYPTNSQGNGFSFLGSDNLLYEGSLMISSAYGKVSNVARGGYQDFQDRSFWFGKLLALDSTSDPSALRGYTEYADDPLDSASAGVKVYQTVIQPADYPNQDFIILSYDVFNQSSAFMDSVYTGLYFDWDIGMSGSNNQASFNETYNYGYARNITSDSLPYIGVAVLTEGDLNYYAIDNGSTEENNPGVWNGFTRREKWITLTGGIARKESSVTDISIVIGSGPATLRVGDTTRVVFAIFCGQNPQELETAFLNARKYATDKNLLNPPYEAMPADDAIFNIYPSPVDKSLTIEFTTGDKGSVKLDIFDATGKKAVGITDGIFNKGIHQELIDVSALAQGRYFLRMIKDGELFSSPFEIGR
jgi:serine protease